MAEIQFFLRLAAKGGEFNKKYGNKLMGLRVYMQAFALIIFAIAVLYQFGGNH